jgi:hypothetical protein
MVQHKKSQLLVIWVIWTWLFAAIIVYQFVLGGGIPAGSAVAGVPMSFPLLLAIGQVLLASAIRWLVVPRAQSAGQLLAVVIVGLALSEAVAFYGLFLVPADQPNVKLTLWMLSLLSALQFIPLYAKSEGSGGRGQPAVRW